MLMILLKIFANLLILFLGLILIENAIKDKKSNVYPKCIWISQFISGIAISFCSFSFWFIS